MQQSLLAPLTSAQGGRAAVGATGEGRNLQASRPAEDSSSDISRSVSNIVSHSVHATQHNMQHNTAQCDTAQHSTAGHGMAQQSTAQHDVACSPCSCASEQQCGLVHKRIQLHTYWWAQGALFDMLSTPNMHGPEHALLAASVSAALRCPGKHLRRGSDMVASTEGLDTQLLTEMQSTEGRQADYLFAAIIRPDRMDPALLGWGIVTQ